MNRCCMRLAPIAPLSLAFMLAAAAVFADDSAPRPAAEPRGDDPAAARKTALESRLVIKVVNPDEARARIVAAARELGGFPILVTDDQLDIKLPSGHLDELLGLIAAEGLVIEKTLDRRDLTLEIAKLEGQLVAKRSVLSRLRGFFDDSDAHATLRIEQTMTELVSEIEQVRGRLRVLEEMARHVRVEISFRFKQRDRLIYVHSPFVWLNTVNLDRFLGEF